jgi:hypothetical protein
MIRVVGVIQAEQVLRVEMYLSGERHDNLEQGSRHHSEERSSGGPYYSSLEDYR